MSASVIAVVVTVGTKEKEAFFLRDCIKGNGFDCRIIDVSTRDLGQSKVDYPWEETARRAGFRKEALAALRRDEMMRAMGEGAGGILLDLHADGRLAGVIAIGGNQGTAIAAIAMRGLPLGFPKIIVSTVASGQVRPYVEYSDVMMLFSVADFINNVNFVNRSIMANAVGAVMGMARNGEAMRKSPHPVIAATAFGNTDAAVSRARTVLEKNGCEVVGFHASGAGGAAMEHLVERGFFHGVLDLTTHELLAEVCACDDIYAPLRPRLIEAGKRGIPQVVAPGAMEYFCFGAAETIPACCRDRQIHYHNPYNTNVRASPEEIEKVGLEFARRLNAADGPVVVLLPLRGFSENGRAGGSLHNPKTDHLLIETIRHAMNNNIEVIEMDANINDEEFSILAAEKMLTLLGMREEKNNERQNPQNYESHDPVWQG